MLQQNIVTNNRQVCLNGRLLDDTFNCSGFLKEGSLFWIYGRNRIFVIDSISGSKICSYQFPVGTSIVAVTPSRIDEINFALYVAIENEEGKSSITCLHVLSGRLVGGLSVENQIVCLTTIKDGSSSNQSCQHWHYALRDSEHLLAAGTSDGHMYIIQPGFFDRLNLSYLNRDEFKPIKILDLDSVSPRSTFAVDFVGFLHSQSSFFWTDGCYQSTVESDVIGVTAIKLIPEADLIAIGFNFGSFTLVSLKNGNPVFCSVYNDCFGAVVNFALQEPENDPRPTLYLWVIRHIGDTSRELDETGSILSPSLFELLQLCFHKKNFNLIDGSLYETLEICVPKYHWSLENSVEFLFCNNLTVNRLALDRWDNSVVAGYDESNEFDKSLVYFAWKSSDGKIVGMLFDINAWYHEQMPSSLSEKRNAKGTFAAFHKFENITDKSVQAIKQLDNIGPKISLNPKDAFEFMDDSGLFSALNIAPSTNKEIRWAIYDVMLFSKRLQFLQKCFIEFRETPSLLTDFNEWSWDCVKKRKELFQSVCDRALDLNCYGMSNRDRKSLRRNQPILNHLLALYDNYANSFLSLNETDDRTLEIKARCQAIRLISLYIRMVLWFLDENVITIGGKLCIKEVAAYIYPGNGQRYIDIFLKAICKLPNTTSQDYFAPKSFQDLLNVYLSPDLTENQKHSYTYYMILTMCDCCPERNRNEMRSICEKFAVEFLSKSDAALSLFIQSFWFYDKDHVEMAKEFCSKAVILSDSNAFVEEPYLFLYNMKFLVNSILSKLLPAVDDYGHILERLINRTDFLLETFNDFSKLDETTIAEFLANYLKRVGLQSFLTLLNAQKCFSYERLYNSHWSTADDKTGKFLFRLKTFPPQSIIDKQPETVCSNEKMFAACNVVKTKMLNFLPNYKFKSEFRPPIDLLTISNVAEREAAHVPFANKRGKMAKKNVTPRLNRNFTSGIKRQNDSEVHGSAKKTKFSPDQRKSPISSQPFSLLTHERLRSEMNLMQYDDIRCLLETPKMSKTQSVSSAGGATVATSGRSQQPHSILKLSQSPRRSPLAMLADVVTTPKHFRFELPSTSSSESSPSSLAKRENPRRSPLISIAPDVVSSSPVKSFVKSDLEFLSEEENQSFVEDTKEQSSTLNESINVPKALSFGFKETLSFETSDFGENFRRKSIQTSARFSESLLSNSPIKSFRATEIVAYDESDGKCEDEMVSPDNKITDISVFRTFVNDSSSVQHQKNVDLLEEKEDKLEEVEETPIVFAFSPPITRSKNADISRKMVISDSGSQTTPFTEKLRRKSVRKTRSTKLPPKTAKQPDLTPLPVVDETSLKEPEDQKADDHVDRTKIRFVFSPPVTRSKSRSSVDSSKRNTEAQTTPFTDRLRRKSIKKTTKYSTNSSQYDSKKSPL